MHIYTWVLVDINASVVYIYKLAIIRMIKSVQLFLLLILISGCNPASIKPVYDSMELSFRSGWPYAFSLKIDSAILLESVIIK